MVVDLTHLNALMDRALTQFARPGDLGEETTADILKRTAAADAGQKKFRRTKNIYGLVRDWQWQDHPSVSNRKGIAKEAINSHKAQTKKASVFGPPHNVSRILKKYASMRGAGPLKALP